MADPRNGGPVPIQTTADASLQVGSEFRRSPHYNVINLLTSFILSATASRYASATYNIFVRYK